MLSVSSVLWTWALVGIVIVVALREARTRRKRLHLPPGPPPLPLLGNALHLPSERLGHKYLEMSQKYGDVVYLNALGQHMVLLGSHHAARELLEKRSANYSDRPQSIMAKLTGLDCFFTIANYGNQWRLHRRVFHQSFNADAVSRFEPIQLVGARRLLPSLLKASPQDVAGQVKFAFASTLMRVAYGIDIVETDDKYYKMVQGISEVGEVISVPGRFPVEAVPSLRYLPSWFPGGGFKRYAADAKAYFLDTLNKLHTTAVDGLNAGIVRESFVTRLTENANSYDLQGGGEPDVEEFAKKLAIVIYTAGTDTTHAAMQGFFLAMAMFPEVQRKAQAELDAVVGPDRLPTFKDQASLPYLNALLKELLRWHTVTPIGVPHCSVTDDEYNGYYIPAGSIMTVNVWALSRDPEVFPDPETFIPERFLDANGKLDPRSNELTDFTFGFGRRICPGRYFAEASLFILAASILHVFNIRPPLDEHGAPQKLEHKMAAAGLVLHPEVYDYIVKPRSARAEQLILEARNSA